MSTPIATVSALAAITLFMIVSLVTVGAPATASHSPLATTQIAQISN